VLEIKAITQRRDPIYQNAFRRAFRQLLLSGLIRTSFIEETHPRSPATTVRG